MSNKFLLLILLIFFSGSGITQTIIKMKRHGGVSTIPCKVNGLDLELIFDTGASEVSISLIEAVSMFNNGKLTKDDIEGTSNYLFANGEITNGVIINIKEIEIAGLILKNIKAVVLKNLKAPLLFGQTAIKKLGKIQLDLNTNTLIIFNGKGNFDFTDFKLNSNLESYYKEFSVMKIEKNDNKEGLFFSFIIPKKWKEQKVTNNELFKNYIGEEYPSGYVVGLSLGLQTLPSLYNNYDSCNNYVSYINSALSNLEQSFELLSLSQIKVSFCKTIKNVFILQKSDDFYKLCYQYWVFCGNKCLSFNYSIYNSDKSKLISIKPDFENFCNSQVSSIIIFNAIENALACSIQSNALENKKEVNITLNNTCNWMKVEGKNDLNLFNKSTRAKLNFVISDQTSEMPNLKELSSSELLFLKNAILEKTQGNSVILASDFIILNKKEFFYLKIKEKINDDYILSENYSYVIDKRLIIIMSAIVDKNEINLEMRFKKNQNDTKELLSEIEIVSNKSKSATDYLYDGIAKALLDSFHHAIDDFNLAIKLNPNFEIAYYNRGNSKLRLKDYKGAIKDFDIAISFNKEKEFYYQGRGVARMKSFDFKSAILDFNRIIELNPNNSEAYYNRGLARILLGNNILGCNDLFIAKKLGFEKSIIPLNKYCK